MLNVPEQTLTKLMSEICKYDDGLRDAAQRLTELSTSPPTSEALTTILHIT